MRLRVQTIAILFAMGVVGLIAAIAGLWVYVLSTTRPLHPDPQHVPSVTSSAPRAKWTGAVEQGRAIARVGLLDQNLPGLSVAVGFAGEVVWAEGFGFADLENQRRVTPDTRFRAGEASKALTSAAVGLLLEQGKLKLDDEIQTYVPAFPKKQWPVTVRQLMGHVAGLGDDAGDEAWLSPCEKTLDGLGLFADGKLLFEPGTRYHASSYGWILVSAAVEAAANERFFRFMRSQIFEPLGMAATRPDSVNEAVADRATFYFPRFAGNTRYGPESAREGDHSCYAGASAFLSTPSDLVRFGMAINSGLRPGSGAEGGKLLQPGTVTLLQTSLRLPSGEETGYGLGWKLETLPLAGQPARMAGHGTKADFIGGTTYLMTFPERGLVVAVMSNTAFADARSVALKIAEAFAAPEQGRSNTPSAPLADYHQHLFSPELAALMTTTPPVTSVQPRTAADLIEQLDAAGIRRAVVLSTAYIFEQPSRKADHAEEKLKRDNDWTSRQVAEFPDRLIGFCGLNPLKDYALGELARCAADPNLRRGLKLHFGNSVVDYHNPAHIEQVRRIFRAANDRRMAIVVHARASVTQKLPYGRDEAMIFLNELLPAAPDVVVQVAHLAGAGSPEDEGAQQALEVLVDAVARHDPRTRRLYFDVTTVGAGPTPDNARRWAAAIGKLSTRVLFGSDATTATVTPGGAWAAMRKLLPLTGDEFDAIAKNRPPYMP